MKKNEFLRKGDATLTYEEWLEETGRSNDEDTYYEYLAYVDAMGEERKPTTEELSAIVDKGRKVEAIHSGAFRGS